jgi:hypothetical protein
MNNSGRMDDWITGANDPSNPENEPEHVCAFSGLRYPESEMEEHIVDGNTEWVSTEAWDKEYTKACLKYSAFIKSLTDNERACLMEFLQDSDLTEILGG